MKVAVETLESLCESERKITYGVVKPGPEVDDGVRFIRGGDVFQGQIAEDALRTISPQLSDKYKRTLLRGGELLVSLVGNPGEVAVVPEHLTGANIARQVGLIPLRPTTNARYVMYFLRSHSGRAQLFTRTQGAVQQVINLSDLRTIEIPRISRVMQDRIVCILSAYDDLIKNNRRRIQLLEEAARLLYREWFVHQRFPGYEHVAVVEGVPVGWEKGTIGDIGQIVTGKTPSKKNESYYGNGVPFIKTPDMHGNTLVIQTSESLSEEGAASQKSKMLPARSILVSCIGSVGVVSMNAAPAQTNQQINAIVPRDQIMRFWTFFMAKDMKPLLEGMGGGATMANVSKSKFTAIECIVPSRVTFEQFDAHVASQIDQIDRLTQMNLVLAQARDLLLPRLMYGEISV